MKKKTQTTPLYARVSTTSKKWLKDFAKSQTGGMSLSKVTDRILIAARKNPKFLALVKGL